MTGTSALLEKSAPMVLGGALDNDEGELDTAIARFAGHLFRV